jgi:dTDP-6-deoxy-L-talose 4-dehydrogenase (NAD+)
MKVLVTGANGFIGKNLVDSLVENNFEVFSLIRNSSKINNKKTKVVNNSLEKITAQNLNDLNIEVVIHLAWSNVSKVMLETHLTEEFEIQKKFVETVLLSNVKKIIISGSCFEYGKINGELNVDIVPEPNTSYGIAKNNLKNWLEKTLPHSNTSVFWLRIFYVYGHGQHERSLYTQLLNSISKNEESFNMSRGFQIRDFISINDTIKCFISAIHSSQKGFNLFNVCSGNPISVREFVEEIINQKKSEIKLNLGYYPIPDYEPLAFWGKKSKI